MKNDLHTNAMASRTPPRRSPLAGGASPRAQVPAVEEEPPPPPPPPELSASPAWQGPSAPTTGVGLSVSGEPSSPAASTCPSSGEVVSPADFTARISREVKLRGVLEARARDAEARTADLVQQLRTLEVRRLEAERAASENAEVAHAWRERSDAFEAAWKESSASSGGAASSSESSSLGNAPGVSGSPYRGHSSPSASAAAAAAASTAASVAGTGEVSALRETLRAATTRNAELAQELSVAQGSLRRLGEANAGQTGPQGASADSSDTLARGMDTVVTYSSALDSMCGALVGAAGPLFHVQSAAGRLGSVDSALPPALMRVLGTLQIAANRLRNDLSQLSLAASSAASAGVRSTTHGGADDKDAASTSVAGFLAAPLHAAACTAACEVATASSEVVTALLAMPLPAPAAMLRVGAPPVQRTLLDELRASGSGQGQSPSRPGGSGGGDGSGGSGGGGGGGDQIAALESLLEARTRVVHDWEEFAAHWEARGREAERLNADWEKAFDALEREAKELSERKAALEAELRGGTRGGATSLRAAAPRGRHLLLAEPAAAPALPPQSAAFGPIPTPEASLPLAPSAAAQQMAIFSTQMANMAAAVAASSPSVNSRAAALPSMPTPPPSSPPIDAYGAIFSRFHAPAPAVPPVFDGGTSASFSRAARW